MFFKKRYLLVLTVLLLLISTFLSGCFKSSVYNSLSSDQKSVIDIIIENEQIFSNADTFRFSEINGDLCFVVNIIEYKSKNYDPDELGSAVGLTKTKVFLIKINERILVERDDEYDPYVYARVQGSMSYWHSDWSKEEKMEALAKSMKNRSRL